MTYRGADVEVHISLTSALVGGEWSALRPSCFTQGEIALDIHYTGNWVGARASLDHIEKIKNVILPGMEPRLLGRPIRSQSLYRMGYLGS
jgi:hypothetical protein